MRRAVLLLVITAAVLAVAGGVALAVNKICFGASGSSGTLTPDCVGTREADTLTAVDDNHHNITGMEGNDIITGGEDSDNIYGDEGNDTIDDFEGNIPDLDRVYGDEGNDTIDVQEATNGEDTVNCGPGKKDRVFFDQGTDTISRTCEIRNPGQ
jgi:Ca2+-binding RTX toxin-like protein